MSASAPVEARAGERVVRVLGAPVHVAAGAVEWLGAYATAAAPAHTFAVITDDVVAALPWFEAAADGIRRTGRRVVVHVVPAGERQKTRHSWGAATDALLAAGCGRDTTVIALGGGVVGDLAGFVAATYMRGVPVVQVPTTLVAMVDAAIGGKTGVDTDAGKNLVGAFHRPAAVVADPRVLETLGLPHVRGGFAEVLKHGAIADAGYFERAIAFGRRFGDAGAPGRAPGATSPWTGADAVDLIARSIEIKGAVVDEDERESGRRETLNFGHTVAHAIELVSEYAVAHGDAVAMGMVAEAVAGERVGVTAAGTSARLRHAIRAVGLPAKPPAGVTVEALVAAARRDKKARGGATRVSLIEHIGRAAHDGSVWAFPVDDATLGAAIGDAFGAEGER